MPLKNLVYIFKIYLKYLDWRVWWLIVFSIIVAFADGIGISMLIPLLQNLELNQGKSSDNILFLLPDKLGLTDSISGILGFIFCIFLLKAIMKFGSGYYQSRLYRILYQNLNGKMYDAILETDYRYFTRRNAGYFITILNRHTYEMIVSFNTFIALITSSFMAFAYLVVAATISWQISSMAMVLGIISLGAMTVLNRYVKKLSKDITNEEKVIGQVAIEGLYAFKYLVSTASFRTIRDLYRNSMDKLTRMRFRVQLADHFTRALQELQTIALLIIMIFLEIVVFKQSIGAVMVILLLFYRAVNQLFFIQQYWQSLSVSQGFIESVDGEFEALKKHKVENGVIKWDTPINMGRITLEKVYFSYGDTKELTLEDINLDIIPNTTIALSGPSGAGKSTFVDLITGLLRPQSGSISVDGIPLSAIDLKTWRSRIGYVSQDISVFDDSIWNNICLYDPHATNSRVAEAARMACLEEFIASTPEGYQTRIGDKGVRLSGGQKQRLFIARELYKQPDLLILDEATSSLDAESERIIQEAIESLKGKITVLIIAHRLSTIKAADQIYVLEYGKIIEIGNYETLVSKPYGYFSKMLALQSL